MSFAPPVTYPVHWSPTSIVTGDFNLDGIADLAITGTNLIIFVGQGDGTFKANNGPRAEGQHLLVEDFNRDGLLDLAVGNSFRPELYTFLGNGAVAVRAAKTNFLGGVASFFCSGDLNGDGKADLLARCSGTPEDLKSFLGTGDGSLELRWSYSLDAFGGIALGDFNNDKKLDAVVSNFSRDKVQVFLGKGDGTFLDPAEFKVDNSPVCVAAGDLDLDRNLDIVTANLDGDSVSVLLGRGDGTFWDASHFPAGNLPQFVTFADLNRDGRVDLIVGHEQNSTLGILLGNGDGTFLPVIDVRAQRSARCVAVADFNGDGLPDLATANTFDHSCSILLNTIGVAASSDTIVDAPGHLAVAAVPKKPRPSLAPIRDRLSEHYSMQQWTVENGLPQNHVQCLMQSQDGYIWIGTPNGLARFDGINFTVFDRNNSPEFKSDNILSMAEGADGILWFGTSDGLVKMQNHQLLHLPIIAENPEGRKVWSVYANPLGGVWIGTLGQILECTGKMTAIASLAGRIQPFRQDSRGWLWAGAEQVLYRVDPRAQVAERVFECAEPNPIRAFHQDSQERIWFGGASGLFRLNDNRIEVYRGKHGLSGKVTSIAEDSDGALWIAAGGHLQRFDGSRFVTFEDESRVAPVDQVLIDRDGNLWLGTSNSGVRRLRRHTLQNYTTQQGLASNDVWSISQGEKGSVWIATGEGVSQFVENAFIHFKDYTKPILQDHQGRVWTTEKTGGYPKLVMFPAKSTKAVEGECVLFHYISSMYEDQIGSVWIACEAGLWRVNPGHLDLYARAGLTNFHGPYPPRLLDLAYTIHSNSLAAQSAALAGILQDAGGRLWVGSMGDGLHCFYEGRFTTLTSKDGLTSDMVAPLLADADGTLWVGSDKGLNRLKNGVFTRYTTETGLAENLVGNLLEDNGGWLWTIGHHGIHRMRKRELIECSEGRRRDFQTISYGSADGMLSSEGNVGAFPGSCKASDGRLWFPTTRGAVVIDPQGMQIDLKGLPAVIEQVLADNEVIFGDGCKGGLGHRSVAVNRRVSSRPTNSVFLPPGRCRVMQFNYTASTFVAPERLRFKVKLEGHDADWQDVGTRRTAIYTDLRPRNYRFRVIAVSPQGVESGTSADFGFILLPFFHQTRWFRLLVVGSSLGFAWSLHRLRVRRLSRRQALEQQLSLAVERERIAKDMHDDLGASLTRIGLLSAQARKDANEPVTIAADIDKIAAAARETAQKAQELVWVVSPRHDTLESLVTFLSQVAREHLELAGVACRLEIPALMPEFPVTSEIRHNLSLFVKEAVNNVVKHAAARQATLTISFEHGTLQIEIHDDGRGLPISIETPSVDLVASRNGLNNLRARIESLHGTFEIRSVPGAGTTVRTAVNLRTPS